MGRRERGAHRRLVDLASRGPGRPTGHHHRRPSSRRAGVAVSDIYVRADGARLDALAQLLATGRLSVAVAATYGLEDAACALRAVASGRAEGALALVAAPR
ncbi:MAG TPA: zinc-binding dehydrogenase [Acidimicrobiales bacterium]|nr:zinc-binding dehydrogenase [Acidimicrobiales bacterium]